MTQTSRQWTTTFLWGFLTLSLSFSLLAQNASASHYKRRKHDHFRHRHVLKKKISHSRRPSNVSKAADKGSHSADLVIVDHIDGSTLYFKAPAGQTAPKPRTVKLVDIDPIGLLRPAPGGQPFYVVHAHPCSDCKQEPGIYLLQAAAGGRITRIDDPGKIIDYRKRIVVLRSRAFYGHCLFHRSGDVLVVFQHERVDRRRRMESSVLIEEPRTELIVNNPASGSAPEHVDRLDETLVTRRMPRLIDTLKLVRAHRCHEIDGRNRMTARHPPDLTIPADESIQSDDDDTPRENQTDRDYDESTGQNGADSNTNPGN